MSQTSLLQTQNNTFPSLVPRLFLVEMSLHGDEAIYTFPARYKIVMCEGGVACVDKTILFSSSFVHYLATRVVTFIM